ncbi:MAG: DinB family protein [Bacteroidota bacterium]
MKRTKWFDRKFPPIEDNGLFPSILERLEYTAIRLNYKIERLLVSTPGEAQEGKWSIKKEIGHLIDLEPLWYERMLQIIKGDPDLKVADLTNRKTHETDYDSRAFDDLIGDFGAARQKMIDLLRNITPDDLENVAIHPRLGTPMRLIDLAYFVAEHDDHHLAQITDLGNGHPA